MKISKKVTFLSLLILLLVGLIEFIFGRNFWCSCKTYSPWSWDIWSSHNSQHLIDPYTFSHILHGLIFYLILFLLCKKLSINKRFILCLFIEAGWELLENSSYMINRYRTTTIALDYFGDSILNSVSDILACGFGFILAHKMSVRVAVLFFLLVEFSMLLFIRDNLTLNVLMLLYPIDVIKVWQQNI